MASDDGRPEHEVGRLVEHQRAGAAPKGSGDGAEGERWGADHPVPRRRRRRRART